VIPFIIIIIVINLSSPYFSNSAEDLSKLVIVGDELEDKGALKKSIAMKATRENATFFTQCRYLVLREVRNLRRDVKGLVARFGTVIFLNLLFGFIFLNAGKQNRADPVLIQNAFGALTMVTISSMFGSASPALLTFPAERPIFLREYATGTYSLGSYLVSKMVIESPLLFLQTIVMSLCNYFLIGFEGNYMLMVLCWWGLALATNSIALLVGSAITDVQQAAEFLPAIFVPQLLFAGFFIATQNIPVWLRWAEWITTLKYTLNLLLLIEFTGHSCNDSPQASTNCESILTRNNISSSDIGLYIGIIAAIFVGLRIVGALLLKQRASTVF